MSKDLPQLPRHFFKYRPLDKYTEQTILENKIYFPSPATFNDPFDGRISLIMSGTDQEWRKYLHKIYRENQPSLGGPKRIQLVNKIMSSGRYKTAFEAYSSDHIVDSIGTLCLSGNATNILMWAHYADAHKGVCLRFKPQSRFFLRAQKINYSEPYPTTRIFDDHLARMNAIILTKSDDWAYEEEWRVLEYDHGPGVYQFPPNSFDAIVVGCRATDADVDRVVDLANRSPSKLQVLRARKSDQSFRLEIETI